MTKKESRSEFTTKVQDAISDAMEAGVNIPWIVGMLEYYKASVTHSMMETIKNKNMSEEETSQSLPE